MAGSGLTPTYGERHVGNVGADAIDPIGHQVTLCSRIVAGPDVDGDTDRVGTPDEIGINVSVVRVPDVVTVTRRRCQRSFGIASGEISGARGRQHPSHLVDGGEVKTRDQPPTQRVGATLHFCHHEGNRVESRIMIGFAAVVLDFDVDEGPRTCVERGCKIGHRRRKVLAPGRSNETAIGEVGIVMDHGQTIEGSAHIEFDAIGAEFNRSLEGCNGVLGCLTAGSSMRDDHGHSPKRSRGANEMGVICR